MEGRIIKGNGKTYTVKNGENFFELSLKGTLKKEKIFIAVGDYVSFNENDLVIEKVINRTSLLKRPRIANVDQILIMHSFVEPDFDLPLVLKYLTYANMNDIKASIVVTKIDKGDFKEKIEQIRNIFSKIGIKTYFVNSKKGEGIDELLKDLKYQTIVLAGQSGVGKSTLLNAIDSNYLRDEGEYSVNRGRGKHKTTEIILLPFLGGYLADTPGFSDIELDLTKEELAKFYPGCYKLNAQCHFGNCLHITEKRCAIKEKVDLGELPEEIYNEYVKYSLTLDATRRY